MYKVICVRSVTKISIIQEERDLNSTILQTIPAVHCVKIYIQTVRFLLFLFVMSLFIIEKIK